jgi:hypothetical protein
MNNVSHGAGASIIIVGVYYYRRVQAGILLFDHTHASYVDTPFTRHRLHPGGLELSMFAVRICRCIGYLQL